jgi:hypothetical protein
MKKDQCLKFLALTSLTRENTLKKLQKPDEMWMKIEMNIKQNIKK